MSDDEAGQAFQPPPWQQERVFDERGERSRSMPAEPAPLQNNKVTPGAGREEPHSETVGDIVGDEVLNHLVSDTLGHIAGVDPTGIAVGLAVLGVLFSQSNPGMRSSTRAKKKPAPAKKRQKRNFRPQREPDFDYPERELTPGLNKKRKNDFDMF